MHYVSRNRSWHPVVPLARIDTPDGAREYTRIYWYHTRPDGTPEQLSDSNGEEVWRIVNDAWGRVDTAWGEINSAAVREDNLRMQGQYLDRETGLHYNLFRYYDADSMHFISPDPIGLAGGLNLYAYAPDPVNWADPWGLKCWSSARKAFWKNEAKVNSHKYSENNLGRMSAGKAPMLQVEVISRRTGLPEIRNVSMELHHKNIPQRIGGEDVHSFDNLDALRPWEHEAVDQFRHTGYYLSRIIKDIDVW